MEAAGFVVLLAAPAAKRRRGPLRVL